jgi:hypothetical protein
VFYFISIQFGVSRGNRNVGIKIVNFRATRAVVEEDQFRSRLKPKCTLNVPLLGSDSFSRAMRESVYETNNRHKLCEVFRENGEAGPHLRDPVNATAVLTIAEGEIFGLKYQKRLKKAL